MSTKNTPSQTPAASSAVPSTVPRSRRRKTIAIGAIVAGLVLLLVIARDPARLPSADVSAHRATPAPVIDVTAAPREVEAPRQAAAKSPRVARTAATTSQTGANANPAAAVSPVTTPAGAPLAPTTVPRTPEVAEQALTATGASVLAPVTITGCLEVTTDGREFRLTDTEGDNAPKSRGWRSGFLKKRASAVALLAPPDPQALRKYVGYRVAATGQLDDRALSMRSFEPAGAMCD
jgi:hypothetical protein